MEFQLSESAFAHGRDLLHSIWHRSLEALNGRRLVRSALKGTPIPALHVRVVALGKVAASMAWGASDALRSDTVTGLVVAHERVRLPEGFELVLGGHPIPDESSMAAGRALLQFVSQGQPDEFTLFLISGGGTALCSLPEEGLSQDDVSSATDILLRSGAPIEAINAVRSRLVRLGNGGLAKACPSQNGLCLMICDIPSENASSLASGPTLKSAFSWGEALSIAQESSTKRTGKLPERVLMHLAKGAEREAEERVLQEVELGEVSSPKSEKYVSSCFLGKVPSRITLRHRVLASPKSLGAQLGENASIAGCRTRIVTHAFSGDVLALADLLASSVRSELREIARDDHLGPCVLVATGEPSVRVSENHGTGGRMQTLALHLALALKGLDVVALCGASDGRDGPSEFAGAIIDGLTSSLAEARGVNLSGALEAFDSSRPVERLGLGIRRFLSGTNLTDGVLVLCGAKALRNRERQCL